MYSLSTRINSVFFFFVVCLGKLLIKFLAILCLFNILTTVFQNTPPTINKFEITKFTSLYNHPYTKVQHAVGLFDMDIDFNPCYNWNSNLVFAWISASYKTGPKGRESKVTVWDNIMLRSDNKSHIVRMDRKIFEYPLVDVFKTLISKEVTFELHWEHMPVIGPILKHKIELGSYKLPEKTSQKPAKEILYREFHYDDDEEDHKH